MIFSSVHIDNFRGIKTAQIDGFREINVFFGKNNCGKSSLLEALLMICGQSNPLLPFSMNGVRGFGRFQEDDLGWVFHNMNTTLPVHIHTEGTKARHMDIRAFKKSGVTVDLNQAGVTKDTVPSFYGYEVDFDGGLHSELLVESGNLQNTKLNVSSNYEEELASFYVTPRVPIVDLGWDTLKQMITNKNVEFLTTVLREIEPKLQAIMVVGDMVMVDLGGEKLLPIQMMGDGVLRILLIIMNVYRCANGILLIDELDNGLHYSVMTKLWIALCSAANLLNVQLFVTTHNIDSLRALNHVVNELSPEYKEQLAAFKLVHTNEDEVKGLRYDADTFDYMINQEIEVR